MMKKKTDERDRVEGVGQEEVDEKSDGSLKVDEE